MGAKQVSDFPHYSAPFVGHFPQISDLEFRN
jgi:hypothetical protein